MGGEGVIRRSDDGDLLLVQRAQGGDARAFEALVLKYQEKIFRLIQRLLSNPEAVEDLAQEVFIKAYRSLSTFRGGSSFYTWVYKIALNTCRNHYRGLGRHPEGAVLEGESATESLLEKGASPEAEVFRAEFWETVRCSLRELPHEQREAVVFCDLEGLSYEEISSVIGIPVGTVRSRLFRGRKSLQGKLAGYLGDEALIDRGKKQ